MNDTIAELPVQWNDDGSARDVVLPHALWSRIFIGSRLVLETNAGDVCAAFVEVGPADAPVLRWPFAPDTDARRVTVRMPR